MEEAAEGVDSEVVDVVVALEEGDVAVSEGGVVVLEAAVVAEVAVVDMEEVVALGEVEVGEEDQTGSGEEEEWRGGGASKCFVERVGSPWTSQSPALISFPSFSKSATLHDSCIALPPKYHRYAARFRLSQIS